MTERLRFGFLFFFFVDDDNVWSFGDGDYGKLGRGGSDGVKVPMKIEVSVKLMLCWHF